MGEEILSRSFLFCILFRKRCILLTLKFEKCKHKYYKKQSEKEVSRMNRKIYRVCLFVVIGIAIGFGIWYYSFTKNQNTQPEDGTFVLNEMTRGEVA